MGLAGPRKRRKIGNDPNNTTWTRSEEGFGHRILKAQGWTPGSFLGATDAAHASHYTSANASHIRAILKDDTLGLGAKRAHVEGENFGLGSFQDLLGRLNGKSEQEIAQVQQTRADLGLKLYAGQKWGTCRFVRGGYLVGDKIEEAKPFAQLADIVPANDSAVGDAADTERASKSKVKRSKEEEKKSKKAAMTSSASESERQAETKEERRLRKAERRAKKEEKRRRQGQEIGSTTEGPKNDTTSSAPSPSSTGFSTPTASGNESAGWAVAGAVGHRQAVRQRFIRQKKMASLDPQALKEILMVKG